MKTNFKKIILLLILFIGLSPVLVSQEPFKSHVTLNYLIDLSDTYDGGNFFTGEYSFYKKWYGASVSFGFFHSNSVYKYSVDISEINKSITIFFDEISIMKSSSISFLMIPVKTKLIETSFLFGLVLASAKSSQFHDVDFSYSIQDNKFNYLFKNYELVKNTHFGYQFGIDLTFNLTEKFGLQLNSRIQDLSNGGTFFFVGTGLCFKL